MTDIQTIGIVGAGLMGTGIAEVAALAGFDVVLCKATPGSPLDARKRIEKSLAKAVERGKLTAEARDAALDRLMVTCERTALAGVDLVIESIVEDLPAKQALFAELIAIVGSRAIFASNTSTLRISEMACARPDRTIGMHFFSPVPAMKLVELVHLPGTDGEVLAAATRFLARLGKTVVPVMDSSGFVVNRLLVPYLVGAIAAYEQGLARPDEIDTAMRLGCGHPVGPLALCDLIGLDIVYAMAKLLFAEFHDVRYSPPALLRRLTQQGHLGKKSGLGFFDYRKETVSAHEDVWALVRTGAFREIREHAA
ncbi:MAG TPA: 3-hydroxybutyryl-CoA dehydrogenase [Haliangiales bacterium]|nr:3-hydroxybutyryl-CoA dehydrogenase [Haliangiales bacterium]